MGKKLLVVGGAEDEAMLDLWKTLRYSRYRV
jgi:hypothetical protein